MAVDLYNTYRIILMMIMTMIMKNLEMMMMMIMIMMMKNQNGHNLANFQVRTSRFCVVIGLDSIYR